MEIKGVLILGEEILPYCVLKTPSNDDFKFCEHDDEHIKKLCLQTTKLINSKTCSKIKFNGHLYAGFRCN